MLICLALSKTDCQKKKKIKNCLKKHVHNKKLRSSNFLIERENKIK